MPRQGLRTFYHTSPQISSVQSANEAELESSKTPMCAFHALATSDDPVL